MKVDVDTLPKHLFGSVQVLLNGREVDECLAADEDAGTVVVLARDEAGELIIDGDELRRKTLSEKVEIILPYGERAKLTAA